MRDSIQASVRRWRGKGVGEVRGAAGGEDTLGVKVLRLATSPEIRSQCPLWPSLSDGSAPDRPRGSASGRDPGLRDGIGM